MRKFLFATTALLSSAPALAAGVPMVEVAPSGGDDTAAIMAALPNVKLGYGNYHACNIQVPSRTLIRGAGEGTTIYPTATCGQPVIQGNSPNIWAVTIEDLAINGQTGAAPWLISLDNAGGGGGSHRIINVDATGNAAGGGLYLGWRTNGSQVLGGHYSHNATNGIHAAGADSTFSGFDAGANGQEGLVLDGSSAIVSACKVWGSGGWDGHTPPTTYPAAIKVTQAGYKVDCWTQDNGGPAISLTNVTNADVSIRSDSDGCNGAAVTISGGSGIFVHVHASARAGGACAPAVAVSQTGAPIVDSVGPIK